MHRIIFAVGILFCLSFTAVFAAQPQTATLTGTIGDSDKKPLAGATVMVFYAGVKKGYSTYCPSCYADCGKRTTTDAAGAFAIKDLNPDLWFTLLVFREGYAPTFIKKVDPLAAPVSATVQDRAPVLDMSHLLRGRVTNSKGSPIADALISPDEMWWNTPNGPTGGGGAIEGLDPIAISNEKGEFEIAIDKPGIKMTITVEARGMAPKRFKELPMGEQRHTVAVDEGATVVGRLIRDGEPVAGVQMGLVGKNRSMGEFFSEVRIGTQPDGTFLFPNIPIGADFYVYPKMESVAALGAAQAVPVAIRHEELHIFEAAGLTVKIGDIQLHPGHRVRGQVMLTDGKTIPDGMTIGIHAEKAWDSQIIALGADGKFEFKNVPTDDYGISPAVKGYRLSRTNPNLSWTLEGFIDSDIEDLIILMEPGKEDFKGLSGGKFTGKPYRSAQRP
jgi:hypothetical protein